LSAPTLVLAQTAGTGSDAQTPISGTGAPSSGDAGTGAAGAAGDGATGAATDPAAGAATGAATDPAAGAATGAAAGTATDAAASTEAEVPPVDYARLISTIRTLSADNTDFEALFGEIDKEVAVNLVTLSSLREGAGENAEDLDSALNDQSARL